MSVPEEEETAEASETKLLLMLSMQAVAYLFDSKQKNFSSPFSYWGGSFCFSPFLHFRHFQSVSVVVWSLILLVSEGFVSFPNKALED